MAIKNGNANHYAAVVFCLAFLFDDVIKDNGQVLWSAATPKLIDKRLDELGIEIDFSQIPPPLY